MLPQVLLGALLHDEAVSLLVERGVSPQKAAQHAGAVSVHSCAHLIDKSFGAVVFNT